jgi:hypothetical protein
MTIFKPHNVTARAMSGLMPQPGAFRSGALGHSLHSPYHSVRGLGAGVASMIPGTCWDVTGFKDCHAASYAKAQTECAAGAAADNFGGDQDQCTDVYADQYAMLDCVPKYCPSSIAAQQQINTGKKLPASTVLAIQKKLNTELAANGFKTITADGKLGPATCGAAQYLYGMKVSTVYTHYNLGSGYCPAVTNPTLVGQSSPVKTATLSVTTVTPSGISYAKNPAWQTADPNVPSLQQQINVALVANGYNPLAITGRLDAQTCGAMKWMRDTTGQDLLSTTGTNCQAYVMPTKRTASVIKPSTTTAPTLIATKPKTSQSSMAAIGGIAALGLIGYYFAKKKGLV